MDKIKSGKLRGNYYLEKGKIKSQRLLRYIFNIYIYRARTFPHSSDIIIVLYRMPLKLLALRPMDRGHAILCQIGILIA